MGAFQLGIWEAQSGKCLPHSMEGFHHTLSADGLRASGEQATVVTTGGDDEELEMGVIWDIAKVGVLLE